MNGCCGMNSGRQPLSTNDMSRKKKSQRAEDDVFRLGAWVLIPGILLGLFFAWKGASFFSNFRIFQCKFRTVTGLPCPGCGGTHAVVSLIKGHILESFKYHAGILYLVLAYAHFMVLYLVRTHVTKSIDQKPIKIRYYAYGFIIVTLLQWVVKLVLIFVLGYNF